jgi:fructoselysine transporter
MVLGTLAYLVWSYYEKVWPFGPKEIREAFVEEQKDSVTAG